MQKVQDDWKQLADKLASALQASTLSDMALARASGADYFAIRRMRQQRIRNRSRNANLLCKFFGIRAGASSEPPPEHATDLVVEVAQAWDGTEAHRAFLEELLKLAGRYRVTVR